MNVLSEPAGWRLRRIIGNVLMVRGRFATGAMINSPLATGDHVPRAHISLKRI